MKDILKRIIPHKKEITAPMSSGAFSLFFNETQNKLTKPYAQLPSVYSCIKAKSRNISQVPFEIFKGDNDKPDTRGAMVELWKGDNNIPQVTLFEGIDTYLNESGNAYIIISDEVTTGGIPKTIDLVPSHAITPTVREGVLIAWTYNGDTIPLERVVHIKFFNPYDTITGLAPATVLHLSLHTDFASMVYNKKFFENDGTPNNIFSTPQNLSKTQRQQLTDVLYNFQKGVNKSHRTLVMDNDVKWMGARTPNKDMEFLAGRKFTLNEVAMVYGVPKEALQQYEDINYATSVTADRSFWTKTLIPEMKLIADTLNVQFFSKYGYRCEFNTSTIKALSQPVAELADAVTKFFQMGVPFDELNNRFGLGFSEFEGSDKPFGGKLDFTPEPEPVKARKYYVSQEEQIAGIRKAQWSEVIDKTAPFVGQMSKAIRGYFKSLNQKLMKRLTGGVVVSTDDADAIVVGLTDDEKLKTILADTERATIAAGAKTIGELNAVAIEQMLANRLEMAKEINKTTNKLLKEALRQSLNDSISAGLTEAETTKALIEAADKVNGHNLKRAKTIARTEVHGAFSESRHEAVKELEPKTKTWLSDVYGGKTRDTHEAMNGETVPFNEKYSNGLMYPLDSSGSAEEVINCRCVEVYGF